MTTRTVQYIKTLFAIAILVIGVILLLDDSLRVYGLAFAAVLAIIKGLAKDDRLAFILGIICLVLAMVETF